MIRIGDEEKRERKMQRNLIDANKENNKAKNGTIYENSKIKGTNKNGNKINEIQKCHLIFHII